MSVLQKVINFVAILVTVTILYTIAGDINKSDSSKHNRLEVVKMIGKGGAPTDSMIELIAAS
jgi:hypothetical protein